VVRVPVERLPGRFVLPADAVASRGPDTVVLLEDGKGFLPVPVRVEHRDARVVVVAADGAVFPGDRAVVHGAYAVLLAVQAATGGGVDPHAGHSH
jgi:multidrug efflux pump subunit AcrA (membrane-fusion protein)